MRESVKEKVKELFKPVNFNKLVKVQQDELTRIYKSYRIDSNQSQYIENLYSHYIEENLPKQYLRDEKHL